MKTQFEVLDRKQMKNILGGLADGSGSGTPSTGNSDADRYLKCEPACRAEAKTVQENTPQGWPVPTGDLAYASCMSACLSAAMN